MIDDRIRSLQLLLSDYVRSPSLRHIRDPHSLTKLANEIVKRLDRQSGIWQKWDGERESLLKTAAGCWIPVGALQDYLNQLPGPALSTTDVSQRLRAFETEQYAYYPNAELRDGCLAIFAEEQAQGTEMPAIIGRLSEYVEDEEHRLRNEQQERYRVMKAREREVAEQRLLSGADCKWTPLGKPARWYCRSNGRTFRLTSTQDKKWELHRVNAPSAEEKGEFVGRYGGRADATKIVAQIAYNQETRY